jgi:hypothetical protein
MSETIWIALIVSIISPVIVSAVMFFTQRANKREDWRRQDEVARHAAAAVEKLSDIAAVGVKTLELGQKTHDIVNHERTILLRQTAISARASANEYPSDLTLRQRAEDAERDLTDNIAAT